MIEACIKILTRTPEDWVEFSAGQNTKTNLKRFKHRNIMISLLWQIAGYLKLVFTHLKLKPVTHDYKDILFFAVTPNQFNVLRPVAEEIENLSYVFITSKTLANEMISVGVRSEHIEIGTKQLFQLCIVHLLRLKALFSIFISNNKLFFLRGKSIFSVHFWIIYHLNILKEIRPRLVVVANDHNAETRSLVEACKLMDIPTAYVQHAEVSQRFHSLDFNISFLHGQHSLEIYKKCDKRRSNLSSPPIKRYYCLVGSMRLKDQKNHERSTQTNNKMRMGLLIKGTDDLSDICNYIRHLTQYGEVIIRPHPNMRFDDLKKNLNKNFTSSLFYSDPGKQSSADFLVDLNAVISGNSTMLLEAAMIGVLPVYVEKMSAGASDYYGFVENGVAVLAEDVLSISLEDLKKSYNHKFEIDAIKYYIDTYGGPMFRNEPKFVSQKIFEYLEGKTEGFLSFEVQ
ncbi:hypothetical protein LSUCC1028_03865 [Rhodobacterales bacterium LSUCC1028]|nr:hypothetical protein [Rhodobacterales bacterium LSUCC1028]